MDYNAFNEESMSITREDHIRMKQKLTKKHKITKSQTIKFRRVFFDIFGIDGDIKNRFSEDTDTYSVYWEDGLIKKLNLEKISNRNDTIYKKIEPLTQEQYQSILNGSYQWLETSGIPLFHELYLQLTINQLELSEVYEYKREVIELKHGQGTIVFNTSIANIGQELFTRQLYRNECLDNGEVIVSYRHETAIPTVFANILNHIEKNNIVPVASSC